MNARFDDVPASRSTRRRHASPGPAIAARLDSMCPLADAEPFANASAGVAQLAVGAVAGRVPCAAPARASHAASAPSTSCVCVDA